MVHNCAPENLEIPGSPLLGAPERRKLPSPAHDEAGKVNASGSQLSRRPQKILLGEIDAGVPQDVVGGRDVKEELRDAEAQ